MDRYIDMIYTEGSDDGGAALHALFAAAVRGKDDLSRQKQKASEESLREQSREDNACQACVCVCVCVCVCM